MAQYSPTQGSGYGKRPLWQWVVIYLVIGIIVYGAVYYFVFAQKGSAPYTSDPGAEQPDALQLDY